MTNENPVSAQEMIMTAFTNIERAEVEKNNKLLKSWRLTIQSIKSSALNGENLGVNLYSHSRIVDLRNGILLVECDHPAWIQTLRLYQKYILTGLRRGVPETSISSLAFRLRGSNAELHAQISEEKLRSELSARIEKEEEMIQNFDRQRHLAAASEVTAFSANSGGQGDSHNSAEKKEMPENLREILDRLKADMLTNGE